MLTVGPRGSNAQRRQQQLLPAASLAEWQAEGKRVTVLLAGWWHTCVPADDLGRPYAHVCVCLPEGGRRVGDDALLPSLRAHPTANLNIHGDTCTARTQGRKDTAPVCREHSTGTCREHVGILEGSTPRRYNTTLLLLLSSTGHRLLYKDSQCDDDEMIMVATTTTTTPTTTPPYGHRRYSCGMVHSVVCASFSDGRAAESLSNHRYITAITPLRPLWYVPSPAVAQQHAQLAYRKSSSTAAVIHDSRRPLNTHTLCAWPARYSHTHTRQRLKSHTIISYAGASATREHNYRHQTPNSATCKNCPISKYTQGAANRKRFHSHSTNNAPIVK